MTSRDFAYWLQGFFEINGDVDSLDETQVEMVKAHLALVFYHEIDPSYTKDKEKQKEMNKIHSKNKEPKKKIEKKVTKVVHEYKKPIVYRC